MTRYINFDLDGIKLRIFDRGDFPDSATWAIFDAFARKTYGRKAAIYTSRVESWSSCGTTHAITVVETPPARGEQSYSVLGEHRLWLDRDEVARVAAFLGINR